MMDIIVKWVACFLIYSFIGWILETTYKSIINKKFINSGFVHGPFCPIYGFGAVIMLLLLEAFDKNLAMLFIVGVVVLSIWEYVVSWLLETVFHTKYWDYSNKMFNIKGRVCLRSSICWGILCVVFIHFIHPFVIHFIADVPVNITKVISLLVGAYLLIDTTVTIVKTINLQTSIKKLKEMADIDGLKLRREELRKRITSRVANMKKAFPTMKSEKINNFLNDRRKE